MPTTKDLHGNVPDSSDVVLLLIDVINDLEFEGGERLLESARPMAKRIAALKARCREAGIPVIYVNDNFGHWQSNFQKLIDHCRHDGVRGEPIAAALAPDEDDYCDYRMFVPRDCVASVDPQHNAASIAYMERVLKVDARPARELDLARLGQRAKGATLRHRKPAKGRAELR